METDTYKLATTISRSINITNFGHIVEGLKYKGYIIRNGWAGEYEREKDQRFSFGIFVSEGKPKFTVQNLTTFEEFESESPTGPWHLALGENVSGPKLFGLDTEFYAVLIKCRRCQRESASPRELHDSFRRLLDGNMYVIIMMNVL
jgi:hypothetical protein